MKKGDVLFNENNPTWLSIIGIVAILMGIVFIAINGSNAPVLREEAISCVGEFEEYDVWEDERTIYFTDGSAYDVHYRTETDELAQALSSLEKGTRLYLLINPNNEYVVEIRTETEELLHFETSQLQIETFERRSFVAIITICFAGGAFLIVYAIFLSKHKKKEGERHIQKEKFRIEGEDDRALRRADLSVKSRILLEATAREYQICYRRVKSINELVINGWVYDECKSVIEFSHELTASVGGHFIEAGCDEDDFSYIELDGERIAQKKRLI